MLMTGDIGETYLSDLHSRTTSEDQMSFSDFTETVDEDNIGTTIAVVTDPTGGIEDVSDEFIPELGMPENELNNFRALRSSINIDDDIKRHNKAVEKTGIKDSYRDYIQNDNEAQEKINELVERVRQGEDITLICFEKEPKWCHRHLLAQHIRDKI